MNPAQAAGLSSYPTAMLPEVFGKGFTPANPVYDRLSEMPAGAMALLAGKGKATPQAIANKLGIIYSRAGVTGGLPSTGRMLRNLARGPGVEDMFEGVKAHKGDQESYTSPGYVYGQEPMSMSEAAPTVLGLVDAALYGEPAIIQEKYGSEGWGAYLTDRWAQKALHHKAGKGPSANTYVANRLFRSG